MHTSLSAKMLSIFLCLWQELLIHLPWSWMAISQFSTIILLYLYLMYTNCTCTVYVWRWPDDQLHYFNETQDLWVEKISLHSSLWFHYREGKWTSWRFWGTLNRQLIHKVPFFKTSYRQFDLFSYSYGKKDFRKINIFFSPTYVSFLTLLHHWGLLAEELSLRQARWIRWQIQQIWIWAFKVVLEVGWFIEQCSLGILRRQESLTVTHLLHIVIGGIKNWIVKLLISPNVLWNQVDDCMSAPSHLGLVKALLSLKN